MKRVGYDADSGKYYYRDQDGSLWEGESGAQYGEMKKVESAPIALDDVHEDNGDIEAAGLRADGYQPVAVNEGGRFPHLPRLSSNSPWRSLFPFLLIIVVVLLLVFRLVYPSIQQDTPDVVLCKGSSVGYRVQAGDTCWDIAQVNNSTLDVLLAENPGLVCEKLIPGQLICVPSSSA
ncbi:hypothetical protein NM688_g8275 [Phlebia brevispora]|uniref:Uncharacterized protein n=1 Tax=Phlebia brevispora TaxID=194682 RepID=A0ACC1RV00_9APHY|nr:hypothetical protein NM688_g8275 [Phlebia brevispora]